MLLWLPTLVSYCVCICQLEEKCLTAQKDITKQTRKNIDLKKELKKSRTEVEELRKEVQEYGCTCVCVLYSFIIKLLVLLLL